MLNFWATWCKPCLRELPHLEALRKEYEPAGLTVVAITIDDTRSLPKVKPYIDTHGYGFKVLLDSNQRVLRQLQGTGAPYVVLLSADGRRLYSHSGYRDGDEKELAKAVAEAIGVAESGEAPAEPGTAPAEVAKEPGAPAKRRRGPVHGRRRSLMPVRKTRWVWARGLGLAACLLSLHSALAPRAAAGPEDLRLPGGFSLIYQMEYSHGESELGGSTGGDAEPIFENWLNADFARGPLNAGLRFVAFNPPDPVIYPEGPDSEGIDFAYAEYVGSRLEARGGNLYALFGRGLALRSYENRSLRVDTNLLGGAGEEGSMARSRSPGVVGESVEGNAEDADRGRSETVGGVDGDLQFPFGLRAGGSWVTTEVPSRYGESASDPIRLEPQRLKAGRLAHSLLGVDLYGEYARVDGPATSAGAESPNVHGHGIYGSVSTAIGKLGLVFDFKDYDGLVFNNAGGIAYILPPAVLREHQYNLLNRHPHQLDTADEIGFQVEATYNTEGITKRGPTSFMANVSLTRNHDPDEQQGNHFDDIYAEVQQDLGGDMVAIGGLSYQRSFDSIQTPDPLLTLWTPIADLRFPLGDRYGLHFQYEHQHASSDRLGSFDTEFGIIEWSRSPNLTASLIAEYSNKSDTQLDAAERERNHLLRRRDHLPALPAARHHPLPGGAERRLRVRGRCLPLRARLRRGRVRITTRFSAARPQPPILFRSCSQPALILPLPGAAPPLRAGSALAGARSARERAHASFLLATAGFDW